MTRIVRGMPAGQWLPDCSHCGIWPALVTSTRCRRCSRYWNTHGVDRPEELIERDRQTAVGVDPNEILRRFAEKVQVTDSCWIWTGARKPSGYGMVNVNGRAKLAHRFAYEVACDPIPRGLVIDHLCSNRACVNPDHLEAVTQQENCRRSAERNALARITSA